MMQNIEYGRYRLKDIVDKEPREEEEKTEEQQQKDRTKHRFSRNRE